MEGWGIEVGSTIRRVELHNQYGGGRQGGISPSRTSPNVLIFSDPAVGEQHGYMDRWVGDEFHYVGEGQQGDQRMIRGNAAIVRHREDGRALRVFWGVRGVVEYAGEFAIAEDEPWYLARARATNSDTQRDVITFRLLPVGDVEPGAPGASPARRRVRPRSVPLTTRYRGANEAMASAPRDPFEVDPDAVDRGLIGHATTQNQLAALVADAGYEPLSPAGSDPDFDLAWRTYEGCVVVEVKSLTNTNQARQLRLGLGQVLDYANTLRESFRNVRPALAVEREPSDLRWRAICREVGVDLVWPGCLEDLI